MVLSPWIKSLPSGFRVFPWPGLGDSSAPKSFVIFNPAYLWFILSIIEISINNQLTNNQLINSNQLITQYNNDIIIHYYPILNIPNTINLNLSHLLVLQQILIILDQILLLLRKSISEYILPVLLLNITHIGLNNLTHRIQLLHPLQLLIPLQRYITPSLRLSYSRGWAFALSITSDFHFL